MPGRVSIPSNKRGAHLVSYTKKDLLISYCTIAISTLITGAFLWLQTLPLWINSQGKIIWLLKPLQQLPFHAFFFSLLPAFFWLLFSLLLAKTAKKNIKAILILTARTYRPFLLLLLPLLGLNNYLYQHTNFFIYLASDLAWPFFTFLISYVLFLQVYLFFNVRPKKATLSAPLKNNRWLTTRTRYHFRVTPRIFRGGIKLLIFAVVLIVYLILKQNFIPWNAEGREKYNLFTGDEPQYCLISHSLVFDGDFDLANNLENRDYYNFYPHKMKPHGLVGWKNSDRYSYHRLGLPIMIAPAYYLGHISGKGARQLTLCFLNILGALLAVIIYSFCFAKTRNHLVSTCTALLIAFTNPIIIYTHQIYPEMVAGLFILCAFCLVPYRPLLASFCIAALPWFHERFGPITLVLSAYLIYQIGWNKKKLFRIFLPLAISAILQILYYQKMYGLPFPIQESWVPGSYDSQFGFFNKTGFYTGLLGLILDRAEGLLIYAPIFALTLVGIFLYLRNQRREALWFIIVFLSYFLPVGMFGYWWGGGAPPPRFLVAIVPLLCLPLCIALAEIKSFSFRFSFLFLSSISLLLGFFLINHPECLYDLGEFFRHHFAFSKSTTLIDLKNYFPSLFIIDGTTKVLITFWGGLIIVSSLVFLCEKNRKAGLIYLIVVIVIVFSIIQLGDNMAGNIGRLQPNSRNEFTKETLLRGYRSSDMFLLYETELLQKQIGINIHGQDASGKYARYTHPQRHQKGFIVVGPYETLPANSYRVYFRLKTSSTTDKEIAVLDIATDLGKTILNQRTIRGTDFDSPDTYKSFSLDFHLPQETDNIEYRVYFLDEQDLWVDYTKLTIK